MNAKVKSGLNAFFKIAVAGGLIYWLIQSGKLDMSLLGTLVKPSVLVISLLLIYISIFVNNLRWKVLLKSQQFPVSIRTTLPLTHIGLFFNFAMPGGVGGDVVKGYYLVQDHNERRLAAATSVLMDRLVGFYIMTFLATLALLFDLHEISQRPAMMSLTLLIVGLFLVFNVVFVFAFSRRIYNHHFIEKIFARLPAGEKLRRAYDVVHSYRSDLGGFFISCGLSILSQVTMILFFIYVGGLLGGDTISWQTYALVVPVGMIATSLPISLAGIGVGQVVFMKLFNWNLGHDTPVASAVITAYQIALFIWGLLGVYFFLRRKKPVLHREAMN